MQSRFPFHGLVTLAVVFTTFLNFLPCARAAGPATIVRFNTVLGSFDIQMFDAQMPRTVTNFLSYVSSGRLNGSAIHRNSDTADVTGGPVRDFVIQGGGFVFSRPAGAQTIQYSPVTASAPIADEPGGGVAGPSNVRGTIAMAKSGPNTATSQWFINQGNNSFLDSPTRGDGGFSAFGVVLGNGMAVVDAIGDLPIPPDFGFSIGGAFGELPLRNFSGNKIEDIQVSNTVAVTSFTILNLPLGDFNRDGVADNADLAILQASLTSHPTNAVLSDGDIDNDRDVDKTDLALFNARGTFAIIDFKVDPTTLGYTVQFTSQSGTNYTLQYRYSFDTSGAWTDVPGQTNRPGAAFSTTLTGNINDILNVRAKNVFLRIATVP